MADLCVRDVMTRAVWCVGRATTLACVAARMRTEAISCVIVAEEGRPLGVISERDMVAELERVLEGKNGGSIRAEDVMSSPVVTVAPGSTVMDAMRQMVAHRIRRLVVVGEGGGLLGVVTQTDLLRAQLIASEAKTQTLEAQVTRRTQDLVEASERLKATNRQRGEFLAMVSHEIRTPLNGILGTVELLLSTGLDDEQRDYLSTVSGSGRALLAILNDVLDLSKIDAGELAVEHEAFDLRQLAKDTARLLDARARERGNTICVRISDAVPATVVGDPIRMQQVLQNLVSNATKFTEDGWIDIAMEATSLPEDRVRLRVEVRDTGAGMHTADVERIFLPYQQAPGEASVRAQGTGLGLTICQRLVELMGGDIGVRSKHGAGSVFWFELLVGRGDAVEKLPPAVSVDRFDDLSVLVVEDDAVSRQVAAKILETFGCRVDVASDGLEAVHRVSAGGYDVVFMDCEMPVLDGFEATGEIRREERTNGRHVHIVAMTGHARARDRDRCLDAGMDAYVTKPISKNALVGALRRHRSFERRKAPHDSAMRYCSEGRPRISAGSSSSR